MGLAALAVISLTLHVSVKAPVGLMGSLAASQQSALQMINPVRMNVH